MSLQLKPAPEYLKTEAAKRAFALNAGYRRLCEGECADRNYVTYLTNRAAGFVQAEDYPIVVCPCQHVDILDEVRFRGAPCFYCTACSHVVRFSFSGNPIHCEAA